MAGLLADLVLVIHFAFVLGVILPVPLILIGAWRGWRWIRNRALRRAHLAMIAFVTLEALVGVICPLTEWEQALRERAGRESYEGSFVAHWVGRALYYDFELWVFTLAYVGWCGLVILMYRKIPPRPRRGRGS